ncbi:MAG: glycosyltransferase [Phycisphaeraceae bacterium]|nr:glycosyltransferase [Phycisphaeraceae bacterium]
MSKLRIGVYLRGLYLEGGGIPRLVLDLCDYLARFGHDTTLATWDTRDVPRAWLGGGEGLPRVVRIEPPAPLGWMNGDLTRQLTAFVERCDVVHTEVIWDPSVARVASIAKRLGRPYVLTPNGMLDDWSLKQGALKKRVYFSLAGRRVLDGAAFIHCASRGELEQTKKHHPRTPGVAIPYVFDLESFRRLPGPGAAREKFAIPEDGVPTILFISRVHYKKRPEALIRAAALLRDRGVGFRVLLAGPGDQAYMASLRALISNLGLDEQVRFIGMVTSEFKASLYQACDVMVLPTSQENFGIVYFESLACGTPVVTTKGTDTWTELQESGGASIIDEGTIGGGGIEGAIADVLAEMIKDRGRMRAMGDSGRAWVMRNLEPARVVEQYIAMYASAMEGRRQHG